MSKLRVALISLEQEWEDKKINRARCAVHLQLIAAHNIDLAVFPELTLTGFTMNTAHQEEPEGPTKQYFRHKSREHGFAIAFGFMQAGAKGFKPSNELCIVDEEQKLCTCYAKVHPFSFAKEHDFFASGEKLVCARVAGVTVGLSICYDLRFPEIFQALSCHAPVLLNIANWPDARQDHWLTLLKARAIENQAYMIGVNRTGTDGKGLTYSLSSRIFSPLGEQIQLEEITPEIHCATLDMDAVTTYRRDFPQKNDRKNSWYAHILSQEGI